MMDALSSLSSYTPPGAPVALPPPVQATASGAPASDATGGSAANAPPPATYDATASASASNIRGASLNTTA